jgi:hypothetical protein
MTNKKEMMNSTSSSALQVVQESARVMTRDDRRIIFEKLNEVYVNDKVGYDKGWTDERVATDLGIPRAWVRLIREENFGDEVGNEEIRQLLQEGQTYLDKIKQAQEGWKARTQEVEDWLRKAAGIGERIARQLADIQKVLK